MWIYSRKYIPEDDLIILNNDYLFSYIKGDGFGERLLSAELLIDRNLNLTFQMKAFQHEKLTSNKSDYFIEQGDISFSIFDYFEKLSRSDHRSLNRNYAPSEFNITDGGDQSFIFDVCKSSVNVRISDGLPIDYFKT